MNFAELFGKATSRWIKYSEYDAVQSGNGDWYIMPTKRFDILLCVALRRVVFQFAHADAAVPYDFDVALRVCLYGFVISLVGEEQTDAPARSVSGVVFFDVQYYHVPRVRRITLRRGLVVSRDVLPAPRLP